MPGNHHRRGSVFIFTVMMMITLSMCPINASTSSDSSSSSTRKLDEVDPIKCSPSCIQSPPPPSPPPPSACPPPPALPPPPPKKVIPSCPPPPPPPASYLYITGPPGDLYPVVDQFGAAAGKSFTVVKLSGLVAFGVMGFLFL